MWRTLVVAALLVLAGCATDVPGAADTDTAGTADQRAMTPGDAPERGNPWGERVLTVAVDNTANESRAYIPLVREATSFWENRSERYAGYRIEYELAPDAENPDVVIEFVDEIESCANVSEPAGCAPYVTRSGQISRPIRVEVVGSYSNESTRLILKHELGHTLGLNHSAGPRAIMAPTSELNTLPRPNATERRVPWDDSEFTVFLETGDRDAEAVREQVRHALNYYADGADGTVPANVSFEFVDDRTEAEVVIDFTDDLACQNTATGSCGRVRGVDPDGDGALERYRLLRISVGGIDTEAVGWHVGYWLGYGFGFEDESDWPEPFRDASYAERHGKWWTDDEE